ncbi:hypothetical protein BGZ94_001567 [Podila epigama]|nr:hypothetical protein BGZ94_001567 [Podila epigama]
MRFSVILTIAAAVCTLSVNAQTSPSTTTTNPSQTIDNAQSPAPAHLLVNAKAVPKPNASKDPCAQLAKEAKNSSAQLSLSVVKACFEAHKFRKDVAEKVLTSVENLIGNFYAFTDLARDPSLTNSSKGNSSVFQTPAVDLLKELAALRTRKFKNDYEFQMAVTMLLLSVNDGHLSYKSNCYDTISFTQPLIMYAPVVNGKQEVRVLYVDTDTKPKLPSNTPKNLLDCVVTTIDGRPALEAVQAFTDKYSALSKDPGVRLNDALGSVSWYESWGLFPGGFANRWAVPEKDSIDYTFKCGSAKPVKVKVPWRINPSDSFEFGIFKDTKSYWNIQCAAPIKDDDDDSFRNGHNSRRRGGNASRKRIINGDEKLAPATEVFRQRGRIVLQGPQRSNKKGAVAKPKYITQAKEIETTASTAFYQLNGSANKDKCVAVIATEYVGDFRFQDEDYRSFMDGLERLKKAGCKKLILDMTNNGGGSVDFAYFVNKVFFPDAEAYFTQTLPANTFIQDVAKTAVRRSPKLNLTFDPRQYVNAKTHKAFKDEGMFTKGTTTRRGGKTISISQRNYFAHSWPYFPLKGSKRMTWKPRDMAIVTNGYCGSACTMIATHFSIAHGVKTYAVGGIQNRPLSYFTFPGGFVANNDAIVSELEQMKYKPRGTLAARRPIDLPVMANTNVCVGEIYAHANSTIPLEYDAKYYPATYHLNHDTVSARHPDQIWLKIAKDFK